MASNLSARLRSVENALNVNPGLTVLLLHGGRGTVDDEAFGLDTQMRWRRADGEEVAAFRRRVEHGARALAETYVIYGDALAAQNADRRKVVDLRPADSA